MAIEEGKPKAQITISWLVDIEKTTKYYMLQSSTSAMPDKPTTNPPSEEWTTTEPSYTSGSTNTLYFVELTVFTNGHFSYSDVSKSSSYEAAKEAYNKAEAAHERLTTAETAIEQNTEAIALRATKTEVAEEIDNIQIGGRNLLRNSDSLSYVDYYFEYDASPKIGYGVIGVMRLGGINGSMIIDQVYYANKVDNKLILE